MRFHPAQLLLALLALAIALASSARGRVEPAAVEAAASEPLAACREHGCGCPHEEVQPSCCCGPDVEEAPRPATPVVRRTFPRNAAAREPAVAAPRQAGLLPHALLKSFRCSGDRSGETLGVSPPGPAALNEPAPSIERGPGRDWTAKAEPEPLPDWKAAPRTPPPRRPHESELH